jgi:hypothetical protein
MIQTEATVIEKETIAPAWWQLTISTRPILIAALRRFFQLLSTSPYLSPSS